MIKHVFVRAQDNAKPLVLLRDSFDDNLQDCRYIGTQDLQEDVIRFPEYSASGIVLDIRAKADFEANDKETQIEIKKNEILDYGYLLISVGMEFEGNIYQVDEQSLVRMSLFQNIGTQWRTIDNKFIQMSPEKIHTLFSESLHHAKNIFDKSRELIDTIGNLSLSEIKNFDVKSKWEN